MCGIAGLISRGRTDPAVVEQMIVAIAHRGPDDQGVWLDPAAGVGIGHRRLAIIDTSPAGHEPMISGSGRLVLTFNGEIYNHREIRARLEEAGDAPQSGWRGHSDAETLLQAIDCWGLTRAIAESVGMFAFAMWDREARTLSMVRDRFGEKPLYYGWTAGDFVFASELKAIRAHPRFDNAISTAAVSAFAGRNHVPAPLSIYDGIFKLPAASILTISLEAALRPLSSPPADETHRGSNVKKYWSYLDVVLSGLADPITDERQALDQLEAALAAAIQGQSIADVPVGAFLSGGIDSSTVCAFYQKHASVPIRTFSIGFAEAGFNEAEHARAVAEHLGTVHHEHYVNVEEARSVIPLLPTMYDEPFSDSSQIPTYLVSRYAREQVTVALTGDGGDELFGGYRRHTMAPSLWRAARRVPRMIRSPAGRALEAVPLAAWTRVAGAMGKSGHHWGGVIKDAVRLAASARSFQDVYRSFLDEWSLDGSPVRAVVEAPGFPWLHEHSPDSVRGMYCDAVAYLPDDILCKVDRASMAVSLETRVPFLDHRLAQVAARIPLAMKVRGREGKLILRRLLGRELPRELFERRKAGFAIPVGDWIRGPLLEWAEHLLHPSRIERDGWFDVDAVRSRWAQHRSGVRDHTPSLWSVLMFQAWLDQETGRSAPALSDRGKVSAVE